MSGEDDSARVKLIIRKWLDIVDPVFEFRSFVVDGRITCIQTYCGPNCYEKSIAENRFVIRDRILEYYESKLKPVLSLLSPPPIYTIDFYFSTDLSQMGVVELNEGPPTAGSLFYDFQNEKDVAIMEGRAWEEEKGESEEGEKKGKYLPDVRVQMEPVRWPNERMHSHVRFLFDELRGRDTSWTAKEPQWGHNVSADPNILPVMCVCRECDTVYERRDLYSCQTCHDVNPSPSEHFLCSKCYSSFKENDSLILKEHVFSPPYPRKEERRGEGEKEDEGEEEGGTCMIM